MQKRVGKRRVMCRPTRPGVPYWEPLEENQLFRVPKSAIEVEGFKKKRIFRYK